MSGRKAMTAPGPKFRFIVSNGQRGPEDPEVRTIIRKQAMRDIGLSRRRRPNHNAHSSAEDDSSSSTVSTQATTPSDNSAGPVWETVGLDDSSSPSDESLGATGSSYEQALAIGNAAPATLDLFAPPLISLQSGYDKTRTRFGIDINSLSVLTNFSMSRTAIPLLSTSPGRLASLLELRQWSYLEHIPTRYDRSPCLAAATDCVLAKALSVLSPSPQHSQTAATLYAKALRSVQDVISDPVASTEPEVLAAVKLLSLHELLDCTRGEAWSHHIVGAARLIKHRSPSRFTTDFEKALLATHAGAIVSETMVRNVPCYLEQPQWTQLLYTLGEETDEFTERSSLVLNIRVKMMGLPGLWHDIDEFMNSEQIFDDGALQKMEQRCQEAHTIYTQWLDEYNAHCVRSSFRKVSPEELELRREMFGIVCECLLLVKRFWACLADDRRVHLELESEALAKLIMGLQQVGAPKLSWLFASHEVGMAKATLATQNAFEEDSRQLSAFEKRLASRRRYNVFCQAIRASEEY